MSKRVLCIHPFGPAGYPPLQHAIRTLAGAGYEICLIGATSDGSRLLRVPDDLPARVHVYSRRSSLRAMLACAGAAWRSAKSDRPQWLYGSDPGSLPIVFMLSCLFRTKLIYHEHDSLPFNTAGERPMRRLLRPLQRWAMRRAELVILPNAGRLQWLRSQEPRARGRDIVAWNMPLRAEIGPVRAARQPGSLLLHFQGSVSEYALPMTLLAAMQAVPGVRLQIASFAPSASAYLTQFQAEAERCSVLDRIQFLGTLARDELGQCARRADVGLALFSESSKNINHFNMLGASNKVFDYLAAGLALLLSDGAQWRPSMVPDFGQCCDTASAASIAAALQRYLDATLDARVLGEAGRQRLLRDWHFERGFAPVLAAMIEYEGANPRSARHAV